MKENVDLTEDGFFSNNISFTNILTDSFLRLVTNSNFPWSLNVEKVESEYDLEHQRESIIVVGNKSTREKVEFFRQMDSMDYCDCCGKRMNLKPWDVEIGVCHKCSEHYFKGVDRCKWRNKEIIRNAII